MTYDLTNNNINNNLEGIEECAPCMWFARCTNDANGLRRGPIGNGEFGEIPICKRCDDRLEAM